MAMPSSVAALQLPQLCFGVGGLGGVGGVVGVVASVPITANVPRAEV